MMTYMRATELLRTARNGQRKLGNNTYLRRLDEHTVAIRLHNTDVIALNDLGIYTLNSGGWQTATTKARINEFSPARVSQVDFVWYVNGVEFYDGMQVNAAGQLVSAAGVAS